ncbi:TWSG1 protein, partial [Polypterus senegalus]
MQAAKSPPPATACSVLRTKMMEQQLLRSLRRIPQTDEIAACGPVCMCHPKNYTDTPPTSKSTVEDLKDSVPSLFKALTEGDESLANWSIVSFPVSEERSHHENLVSFLETLEESQHKDVSLSGNRIRSGYNPDKDRMCTVVYFDDCMSMHQCKMSCQSMGSSKYRWFHNACCECIGPECTDYGSKSVKCVNCMV